MVEEWFIRVKQTVQLVPPYLFAETFVFLYEVLFGHLSDLVYVQQIFVALLHVVLDFGACVKFSDLQLQLLKLTEQFVILQNLLLSQFRVSVNKARHKLQ